MELCAVKMGPYLSVWQCLKNIIFLKSPSIYLQTKASAAPTPLHQTFPAAVHKAIGNVAKLLLEAPARVPCEASL